MAKKKGRRTKPRQRTSSRSARKAASARKTSRRTKRTVRARKRTSLAGMTFDALISVRDEAERLIKTRAATQRKALEKQLARISSYVGMGPATTARRRRSSLKGRKVAPKYRNPANKSETWAGRGVRPRWLQSQLKAGHKMEEFRIAR
jgi:DNA-binding protein H-NS